MPQGKLIEESDIHAITAAGIQEVKIRSVLTCEAKTGVCGTCYGRDLARGTPVNVGEAVGVIAAQSIGEPGTQLTMRTFHIGGAAQISENSTLDSGFEGTVKMRNRAVARNSDGDLVAIGRNVAIVITGPDGAERAVHRIQYGAKLRVDEGDTIKRGQRIAEWDPYTRPIITEVDGFVGYEDLYEGSSLSETTDEATGISKRVVTDWRTNARSADLKPAHVLKGKDDKVLKLARGGDARYMLPVDAVITSDPGTSVKAGDTLPVSRWRAPRPATSRAVCRAWRSCSRRVVRRRRRSSPRPPARSASAATTRTSVVSPSRRTSPARIRSST